MDHYALTARLTRRSARRGVMLLIVTLVITTLTLSGAALLFLMKTERDATQTRGLDSLVRGVNRSAVVFLIGAIESSPAERAQFGGLYNNPNYFCAVPLLTIDEGGEDSSRFTVVSPVFLDTKIEGIRYGLVDESTRLNLEAALAWENETPGAGRNALMKMPGMTATAADSILDWIDPDENPRANGGEAAYYASKNLPYSPRNAVPVFLEEILLARGVTRSQLYGSDENFTYNADKIQAEEEQTLGGSLTSIGGLSPQQSSSSESVPWKELLTVFSAEKDVDPTGEARVDLNAANLRFLYQELETRVGADLAKFVVLYRQYGPQAPTEDTSGANARTARRGSQRRSGYAVGAGTAPNNVAADGAPFTQGALSSVQLNYATNATTALNTPLDIVGARVVVGNVVYDSPIPDSRSSQNIEKLFQFLDYCSTSASTTIVGRVNINAAPRVVLSAIPGLSATDVQTIVSRRPEPSAALPKDFRHASWLYAKELVDLPTMRQLYNKVTAQGDVYRGQVIGFLDGSDETARAEVVIDGTTIPPRQVFYKDLTTLGKGFGPAVLLGGLTSEQSQQTVGAQTLDSGLFEIDSPRTSGYTSGGAVQPVGDPFAAIDSAAASIGGTAPRAGSAAPTDAFGTIDVATNVAAGSMSGMPSGPVDPVMGGGVGMDASLGAASEGAAPSAGAPVQEQPTSRREQLVNTLRGAREQRQARYESLSGNAVQETQVDETSEEAAPSAVAPAQEQPPSRREQLLNTLRGAREQRQTRYDSLSANAAQEPQGGAAPTEQDVEPAFQEEQQGATRQPAERAQGGGGRGGRTGRQ